MHLFGRKHDRHSKIEKSREDKQGETGCESERDRLLRQLEEERRQRLEDIHKERAERLDAQEEQRRLEKESRRLTQEASDLRLEQERARARRKGFFETLFGGERSEKTDDRR